MAYRPADLECISDRKRAAVLLASPRIDILREAREPISASAIADRLGWDRQRLHYHVRMLAQARFLRRAGRKKKRGLVEQRYVASARAYVFSPEVLGPLQADWRAIEDTSSAPHLMALTAHSQAELGHLVRGARGKKREAVTAVQSMLRFKSAEQRTRFGEALEEAIAGVVARFAEPASAAGRAPVKGQAVRLVVGCYPVPTNDEGRVEAGDEEEGADE